MNAAKLIGTIGLTIAGLGGAGFLYSQAQDIDTTRIERAASLLQTLQGLDGRWSVELLKVSNNPQAHFDGLAAISPEVTRHSGELRKIARGDPSISPDLSAALLGYISRLNSKAERVERFKSAYAIVRNSERYMPIAAQLVSARAGEFKQMALDTSVKTYHADLKNYFANPSEIEKQRLMSNLSELRSKRNEYPSALRSALGNFLAHGLVLMAQKGPLNELSSSATSMEASTIATGIIDDLKLLHSTRADKRSNLERYAIAVLFLTVVGVALMSVFGRRAVPGPQFAGAGLGRGSEDQTVPNLSIPQAYADDSSDLDATVLASPQQPAQPTLSAAPTVVQPQPVPAARPASAAAAADAEEKVRTEFLVQLVRASARRVGSHVGLMKEVYVEVAKGIAQCQANLVVGDTRAANTAIVEAKATLGELSDVLDLNSVPRLINATSKTIEAVERSSTEFHRRMESVIETEKAPFDVSQCLERALAGSGSAESGVSISKNLVPVHDIGGSSVEMAVALRNIIANACEELKGQSGAGVLKIQTMEELGAISITFTDNGQGMENEVRQQCTHAFFSTKEGHEGLGLSTSEYIIRKHGGRLNLNSMPGKGTVVRVLLPGVGEELPPE